MTHHNFVFCSSVHYPEHNSNGNKVKIVQNRANSIRCTMYKYTCSILNAYVLSQKAVNSRKNIHGHFLWQMMNVRNFLENVNFHCKTCCHLSLEHNELFHAHTFRDSSNILCQPICLKESTSVQCKFRTFCGAH